VKSQSKNRHTDSASPMLSFTDALLRDGWVAWLWLGPVGDFIDFDGNGLGWVWVCRHGCGGYGWLPWLRRREWVVDLGCAWLLIWAVDRVVEVVVDRLGFDGCRWFGWSVKKIYKKRIIL
jgi:hypothetical protein